MSSNVCAKHFKNDDIKTSEEFKFPDGRVGVMKQLRPTLRKGAVPSCHAIARRRRRHCYSGCRPPAARPRLNLPPPLEHAGARQLGRALNFARFKLSRASVASGRRPERLLLGTGYAARPLFSLAPSSGGGGKQVSQKLASPRDGKPGARAATVPLSTVPLAFRTLCRHLTGNVSRLTWATSAPLLCSCSALDPRG